MADDASKGLLPSSSKQQQHAVFHDSSQSSTYRFVQVAFVSIVTLMVLITMILSIVRGVQVSSAMYFMMGLSLLGFVAIEVILLLLVRKDELPEGKSWFLYFVGVCILLEAIFTDVLLYQN